MSNTICLNLLTDSSQIGLEECLKSVLPYIDYWVIADMGIDEQTEAIIEKTLDGIAGEIVAVDSPEVTLARNALLTYSQDKADYLLLLDDNMKLQLKDEIPAEFDLRDSLDGSNYHIEQLGMVQRADVRLISAQSNWLYYGHRCEVLISPGSQSIAIKNRSISITSLVNVATDHERIQSNIKGLQESLADNSHDQHAVFHLGKNYMEDGEHEKALECFSQFLAMPDLINQEWQWYALYHRAKLMEILEHDDNDVIEAYYAAYHQRPCRAEAPYNLARFYREHDDIPKAHLHAHQAYSMPLPDQETFDLEQEVYSWHIPTEYALACQKMNYIEGAVEAANKAMRTPVRSKALIRSLLTSRQSSVSQFQAQFKTENKGNNNVIRVVVPYRNAGSFLKNCVNSLQHQDYQNFTATFIDDCSTDDSNRHIPQNDDRFELIVNKERVGPLVNRMDFINRCDPDDIVLYLDGDDQLASDDALSYVNQLYNENDCWLTYGQYISQGGNYGYAQPYASKMQLMTDLENGTMRFPMHPITHRAGLFHWIKEYDPNYTSFKDDDGKWLFYASDAVMARPLFYLANFNKIHYCHRALYLYTEGHDISESIHNKADQIETCRIANSRLRPPRISHYKPEPAKHNVSKA